MYIFAIDNYKWISKWLSLGSFNFRSNDIRFTTFGKAQIYFYNLGSIEFEVVLLLFFPIFKKKSEYLILFTDRCSEPLQAPEKVEEIQNKLIKVLEVQLRKTYPQDGVQRLAKLLNVFVRLREYSKEFDNILETMSKDDILIECIPEMLFFFWTLLIYLAFCCC